MTKHPLKQTLSDSLQHPLKRLLHLSLGDWSSVDLATGFNPVPTRPNPYQPARTNPTRCWYIGVDFLNNLSLGGRGCARERTRAHDAHTQGGAA